MSGLRCTRFSCLRAFSLLFLFYHFTLHADLRAKRFSGGELKNLALLESPQGSVLARYESLYSGMKLSLSDLADHQIYLRLSLARPRKFLPRTRIFRVDGAKPQKVLAGKGVVVAWKPEAGEYEIRVTPIRRANKTARRSKRVILLANIIESGTSHPGIPPLLPPSHPGPSMPNPGTGGGSGPGYTGPPLWTASNGLIFKNGNPFFPFGMYHITHYNSGDVRRLKDIQTIASLGLNTLYTPIDYNDRAVLDLCEALGIEVMMEFNGIPEDLIRQFGNHRALAFLNTFDDVDQYVSKGMYRWSPSHVQQRSAEIKALLPRTLTYISAGWPNRIGDFVNRSDLIAQQGYPVPFEPLSSLTPVYLKNISQTAYHTGQGYIANLQTFGWNGVARYPTARELRNMTYQTLLMGAHGILYYTFVDGTTDLQTKPDLLAELKKLSSEVKTLQDALLLGARTVLSTGDREVFAGYWRYGSSMYVAVVNASESRTKSITLSIPAAAGRKAKTLFTGREASLTFSGTNLHGNLQARDVQVYELQ